MDTMNVMLAHIQDRIRKIESSGILPVSGSFEAGQLLELSMMLECLRAANNLQQLAKPEPPEMFTTTL